MRAVLVGRGPGVGEGGEGGMHRSRARLGGLRQCIWEAMLSPLPRLADQVISICGFNLLKTSLLGARRYDVHCTVWVRVFTTGHKSTLHSREICFYCTNACRILICVDVLCVCDWCSVNLWSSVEFTRNE